MSTKKTHQGRDQQNLTLDTLHASDAVQARTGLNPAVVAEYAEAMENGASFPPIAVFKDGRGTYWLADGFHRVAAAKQAGFASLRATVQAGTRKDAILFAVGSNAHHGLPRTNADKRKAVMMLLGDRTWSRWSDREIARRAKVSNRFVSTLRKELTVNVHSEREERMYRTKHGTLTRMNVANIGLSKQRKTTPFIPPFKKQACPETLLDTIINGDCLTVLRTFPDECIDCIVTSPPYWGLRDYSSSGQVGLEPHLEDYLQVLLAVTGELRRVLKPSGTLWWIHGDSYASSGRVGGDFGKDGKLSKGPSSRGRVQKGTCPEKSLLLQNYRLAARMIDKQAWILRNQIIWHKPNGMPAPVIDRFTVDFEVIFFFTKSKTYWFEQQREPNMDSYQGKRGKVIRRAKRQSAMRTEGYSDYFGKERNKRSVWSVPTRSLHEKHFATFPRALIETPIRAGCPEGGVVLDPFMGVGTTARVAQATGRHYIGIELSAEYCQIAERNLHELGSRVGS